MKETDGKFYKGSLRQGFDRGASVRLCDIQNAASRRKTHGNAKRTWESAVENKGVESK